MSHFHEFLGWSRRSLRRLDINSESNFNFDENCSGRPRGELGLGWTRPAVCAVSVVDDRIIVDRHSAATRRRIPSWVVRGVLTTFVIATIGFSLQRILMPAHEVAAGNAVGRWGSAERGHDAEEAAQASVPIADLTLGQQSLRPISREAAIALNNTIPFSTAPVLAATPFVLGAANEQDRDRATACLAQAIYYEAGGDTPDDQRAVAQVVLNRVRHPSFPKTVCGVVFQGSQLRTGCQFTFTCDGSISRVPEGRAWARAQVMAVAALNGAVFAPVGYATHFHTPSVAPYWAPTLEKIVQIGGHLFYRWPGGAGAPRAFAAGYAGGEGVGTGTGADPGLGAPTAAGLPGAPSSPDPSDPKPRKVEVMAVDQPVSAPVVAVHSPLVAAPQFVVLATGPRLTERTYHPPVPRGGSAQPLLSRDR